VKPSSSTQQIRLSECLAFVAEVDAWLDENVSDSYKEQPLAQHWARVAKAGEEAGEAVDALIAWTGQNPRKPHNRSGFEDLMDELADTALTAIYGMQHFTKDAEETLERLRARLAHHHGRLVVRNG
jgi:phosphoribosyl-ATP pyrophosphohydrolase